MHRGLEERVLALALSLRRVHRDVCIAEQVVRPILVVAAGGDPDAGRDRQFLPFDRNRDLERLEEPLADRQGSIEVVDVVEEDRELVAAKACGDIARADAVPDPIRDSDEQPIAFVSRAVSAAVADAGPPDVLHGGEQSDLFVDQEAVPARH